MTVTTVPGAVSRDRNCTVDCVEDVLFREVPLVVSGKKGQIRDFDVKDAGDRAIAFAVNPVT